MEKSRKLVEEMTAVATAVATAMSTAAILTEDMLVEILVKLPVKSLVRFRCVSKSWLNLIKSPNFVKMHLKYHHSNTKNDDDCILIVRFDYDIRKCLLSFHSYETLSSIISSPPLEVPHLKVANLDVCGPCNGVICISDGSNIVLCNPALREFKLLPLSPSLPYPEGYYFTREAIGFGFDSSTNDYKVVAFVKVTNFDEIYHQLEIYYLSSNSWIQYKYDFYLESLGAGRHGTLFNGEFFWFARDCACMYIMKVDMSTEEFSWIELPERIYEEDRQICVKVFGESLAIWSYTCPEFASEGTFVDVWVMHEFGEGESCKEQFRLGPLEGVEDPVMIWKNEAFLMASQEDPQALVSCALDTQEVTPLDIHGLFMQPMVYRESLVSFK